MAYDANSIAAAFIRMSNPDAGDVMTNLKLQKLLYYAQGYYLAAYEKPLFREPIYAWDHGPVVKAVWDTYGKRGADPILPEEAQGEINDREVARFLAQIWALYGQFSAWKLREMTHKETPWRETGKNGVIKHALLKDYFSRYVRS